ncbi:hypothetical protein HDV00_006913 [Rhizophlyctis rosea]|nr:hypothetical protein HDV00_006913 [Rhizophlyctis rosea]
MSLSDIASYFNIPLQHEVAHATLPMTMLEAGPLKPFAEMLQQLLNDLGTVLEEKGHQDLSSFLTTTAKDSGSAAVFVESLVRTLPALRDGIYLPAHPLYLFTRAQRITRTLHQMFPTQFTLTDMEDLTVCVTDSTIPSFLTSRGILRVDQSILDVVSSSDNDLEKTRFINSIRGAAADACLAIVEKSREVGELKDMSSQGLDAYLWGMVKESTQSGAVDSRWWADKKCIWY